MNYISNFLKGILIGVGNIAPGVSGGALAMIFGMYEDMVNAVGNFFKNMKKNIIYLAPIGLGAAIGVVGFSKILKFLLKNYTMPTTYAFAGLIIGTLPVLFKRANKNGFKKPYLIPFIITLAVGVSFAFYETGFGSAQMATHIDLNAANIVKLVAYGFLIAGSIVIPGISGSVLLMLMGAYGIVLEAISTIDIIVLFPMAAGLGIGVLFFSKLMGYLLGRYHGITYYAVLGFVIGAIPEVMTGFAFNMLGFFSVLCFLGGLAVSYSLSKLEKD